MSENDDTPDWGETGYQLPAPPTRNRDKAALNELSQRLMDTFEKLPHKVEADGYCIGCTVAQTVDGIVSDYRIAFLTDTA